MKWNMLKLRPDLTTVEKDKCQLKKMLVNFKSVVWKKVKRSNVPASKKYSNVLMTIKTWKWSNFLKRKSASNLEKNCHPNCKKNVRQRLMIAKVKAHVLVPYICFYQKAREQKGKKNVGRRCSTALEKNVFKNGPV